MGTLYINGKFAAQPMTGVQRYAGCLVQALDARLGEAGAGGPDFVLLCPPQARPAALRHISLRRVGRFDLPLHLWEQLILPLAARDGWLLNLSGSAPMTGMSRQICTLHDAAVFDHPQAYTPAFVRWYTALFRRASRRAAQLATVSAFSLQRLEHWLPAASGRLIVVPNGGEHLAAVVADESAIDRLGLVGRRFFLAVGSANPTKNMARLERAFAALDAGADVALVIVGGVNSLAFATVPLPLHPARARVVRAGQLADAEVKALYKHATALVFPSLYEGFGLPLVEAMACGCPVAAADIASANEVCGSAALSFDPQSETAMVGAMRLLLDNGELRGHLREAGLARAALFSWARSAAIVHDMARALTATAACA